jgi:hypothetical protein
MLHQKRAAAAVQLLSLSQDRVRACDPISRDRSLFKVGGKSGASEVVKMLVGSISRFIGLSYSLSYFLPYFMISADVPPSPHQQHSLSLLRKFIIIPHI